MRKYLNQTKTDNSFKKLDVKNMFEINKFMTSMTQIIKIQTDTYDESNEDVKKKINEDEINMFLEELIIDQENPDKFKKMNIGFTGMNLQENQKVEVQVISDNKMKSEDI